MPAHPSSRSKPAHAAQPQEGAQAPDGMPDGDYGAGGHGYPGQAEQRGYGGPQGYNGGLGGYTDESADAAPTGRHVNGTPSPEQREQERQKLAKATHTTAKLPDLTPAERARIVHPRG